MEHTPNHVPTGSEPVEYDPFEMDWPWPGMLPAEPEPAAADLSAEPQRSGMPLRAASIDIL